jgi:hypothetical protein
MRHFTVRGNTFVFCLSLLSSCSSRNLDLDDESGTTAEDTPGLASALGGIDLPREWACLQQPPLAETRAQPFSGSMPYRVPIVDFATSSRVPGLVVELCLLSDSSCAVRLSPPVRASRDGSPTYTGWAPFGFEGYLWLAAPGYMPGRHYFGGPLIGSPHDPDAVDGPTLSLFSYETLDGMFARIDGAPRDPEAGLLSLRVVDCDGSPVAGARVELDEDVSPAWQFVKTRPVAGAVEPVSDIDGAATFVNVPASNLLVESRVPCDVVDGAPFTRPTLRIKSSLSVPYITSAASADDAPTEDGCTGSELVLARAAFRITAGEITFGELRPDYSYGR